MFEREKGHIHPREDTRLCRGDGRAFAHASQSVSEVDVFGLSRAADEIAAGVLLECQRQSINVPEDIGIAGVHALDIGQSMMPRLASIVTPDRQTGEKAMLSLLAQIQGVPHRTAPLEFELDEGESLLPEFV